MMKALRVRNSLVRECMAEILGTFVLMVSESVSIKEHAFGSHYLDSSEKKQLYIIDQV